MISTPLFTAIITTLMGGIIWLVKRIFDRSKQKAELDKEVALADKENALAEQAKINNVKLQMEVDSQLTGRLLKEIERLLEDKKIDTKAKLDLIEINRNLSEDNKLLREEVQELRYEIRKLRLELVEAKIINDDPSAHN